VNRIDAEVEELDNEIAELVEKHGEVTSDGLTAINTVIKFVIFYKCIVFKANEAMADLKQRIEKIRGKALLSENNVLDMTRDITQVGII
jgi:prefoldin subunit 5